MILEGLKTIFKWIFGGFSVFSLLERFVKGIYFRQKERKELISALGGVAGYDSEAIFKYIFSCYVKQELEDVVTHKKYNTRQLKKELKPDSTKNKITFLLGDPGIGKSTLMIHLAYWYCHYNNFRSSKRIKGKGVIYYRMCDIKTLEELEDRIARELEMDEPLFKSIFLDGLDEFISQQKNPAEDVLRDLFFFLLQGDVISSKLSVIRKIYVSSRREPFAEMLEEYIEELEFRYKPQVIMLRPLKSKQSISLYKKRGGYDKRGRHYFKMRKYMIRDKKLFSLPLMVLYADAIFESSDYSGELLSVEHAIDIVVKKCLSMEYEIWYYQQDFKGKEKMERKDGLYFKEAWKVIDEICLYMLENRRMQFELGIIVENFKKKQKEILNREPFYFFARQLIRRVSKDEFEFVHPLFRDFALTHLLLQMDKISFRYKKEVLSDINCKKFYSMWIWNTLQEENNDRELYLPSMSDLGESVEYYVVKEAKQTGTDTLSKVIKLLDAKEIVLSRSLKMKVNEIIWYLPCVKDLRWKTYHLKDTEIICLMEKQEVLFLTDGRLDELKDLNFFGPLKRVNLEGNNITNIREWKDFEDLKYLEWLCLNRNPIKSFEPLRNVEIPYVEMTAYNEQNVEEILKFPEWELCCIEWSQIVKLNIPLYFIINNSFKTYVCEPDYISLNRLFEYNNMPLYRCRCLEKVYGLLKMIFSYTECSALALFDFGIDLGICLYKRKKYSEALEKFSELEKFLDGKEKDGRLHFIRIIGWKGRILAKKGDFQQAALCLDFVSAMDLSKVPVGEKLLFDYWRIKSKYCAESEGDMREFLKEHSDEVIYKWGIELNKDGEYEEAGTVIEEYYKRCCVSSDDRAEGSLVAQHLLGQILYEAADYERAEKELADCLSKRNNVLGQINNDTLNTQFWLGATLYQIEKYEKAEKIFLECLEKRKEILGMTHEDVLNIQWWLGETLYQKEDYEEAERVLKECLEKSREVGVDTLKIQFSLGKAYYQEKKYDESEKELRECLTKWRAVSDELDENIINTQDWLGIVLCQNKKYDEAEKELRECLEKRRKISGENDSTLQTQLWLGVTLYRMKMYEDSKREFEDCLEKRKKESGEYSDKTLDVRRWLEETLYKMKRYDEAEKEFRECPAGRKMSGESTEIL